MKFETKKRGGEISLSRFSLRFIICRESISAATGCIVNNIPNLFVILFVVVEIIAVSVIFIGIVAEFETVISAES